MKEITFSNYTKGKVVVFIDVANIFYAQKTLRWRISYQKLYQLFKNECNLVNCYAYTAIDPSKQNQLRFINLLNKVGYIVRTKPIKAIRISNKVYERKGNLDIELCLDVWNLKNKFKTMILLSGDSDFAPLIERVKKLGKRVIVISTKHHISRELLILCKYINLKKLRKQIELKKSSALGGGGSSG